MMKRGEQLERLLKPLLEGNNLNWEVADRYLKLLSSSLGSTSRYRIMTSSFFRALDSQNNTKMKKYLNEQGVRLAHVILIPILANHRWYFAKVENEVVTLYDCNEDIEDRYRAAPPVREICRAVKDENIEIQVSAEFPRMHSNRDSGIFMLMGIRDVVQEQGWTFTEEEVKQKRVQIAQELLEGKLSRPEQ
jgi:Ulp1 family protease